MDGVCATNQPATKRQVATNTQRPSVSFLSCHALQMGLDNGMGADIHMHQQDQQQQPQQQHDHHQQQQQQEYQHHPGMPGGDVLPGMDASGNMQQQHQHQQPPVSQPLQLTQLLGSEADQQVLLHQPKVHIIARAKMPRGDRLVSCRQLVICICSAADQLMRLRLPARCWHTHAVGRLGWG